MKHLLVVFLLCCAVCTVQAQHSDKTTDDRNLIFTRTEVPPSFNGGEEAWKTFFDAALDKSVTGKVKQSGTYTVLVQFIVHKDGSLSDVKALSQHGNTLLEEEAKRIIMRTPKWIPAKQNGHIVKSYHKQTIHFIIP